MEKIRFSMPILVVGKYDKNTLSQYFEAEIFYFGGFSVVPICLLLFSLFMFKDEFKKQKLLCNYVLRAKRRADDYKSKRV